VYASPALSPNGNVIVSGLNGKVHAVSPDGELVFSCDTGAYFLLSSPVCDAENRIWACDIEGKIHQITPEGKSRVIQELPQSIEGSPSAMQEGNLLIPCMDGNVYVI
jgi:outer membrane protein assembly factor BamB